VKKVGNSEENLIHCSVPKRHCGVIHNSKLKERL